MQIDRERVVDLLEGRGDADKAEQARHELPATVDSERDADALTTLGVSEQDLEATETATRLGSGQASGLGVSQQSEPEPLLGDDERGA